MSFEDYRTFVFYQERVKYIFTFLIWFIFFIEFFIFFLSSSNISFFQSNQSTILAFFLSIGALIPIFVRTNSKLKKAYNSDSNFRMEQIYAANADGFSVHTEQSDSKFAWRNLFAVYEHKEMIIIYVSNTKAFLIPKRFFSSEEDRNNLKTLITENAKLIKVKLR